MGRVVDVEEGLAACAAADGRWRSEDGSADPGHAAETIVDRTGDRAPSIRRRRAAGRGDLLAAVFDSARDVPASYAAYLRYRDCGCRRRDLEAAFTTALPVLREVCSSRDRVLVGAAAFAIFRALQGRRFKTGGPGQYWAYLRQTARGALAHQRKADDRFRLVDRVSPHDCFEGMGVTGRLVNIVDVERKLVLEKIPILVAEEVVGRLAFDGDERAASLYILRSRLEGRDVVVRGLRVLFDVPCERLRQIVDYVTVAARIALARILLSSKPPRQTIWDGAGRSP